MDTLPEFKGSLRADDWTAQRDHELEWIPAELCWVAKKKKDEDYVECKFIVPQSVGHYARSPCLLDSEGAPVEILGFSVELRDATLESVESPEGVELLRALRGVADVPGSVPTFFATGVGVPLWDLPTSYEFAIKVRIAPRADEDGDELWLRHEPELWLQHATSPATVAAAKKPSTVRVFQLASECVEHLGGRAYVAQPGPHASGGLLASQYVLSEEPVQRVDLRVDGRLRSVPGALLERVGRWIRVPSIAIGTYATAHSVRAMLAFATPEHRVVKVVSVARLGLEFAADAKRDCDKLVVVHLVHRDKVVDRQPMFA